jgi:glutathione S-transferase
VTPQGRVPTLVIDDEPYAESAALLMLLAERHPSACLAPAVGAPDRARWLVGMVFLANTVLPAMRDNFYAGKDGDPSGAEAVVELARRRIEDAMDVLDRQLDGGRRFLVGDSLTTVDLLAVMLMRWARAMPKPATEWPNLRSYIGRMTRMPSWIELNRREGLTGWPPVLE